jgi:S-(hydroxymethyl)glutathione dehydrogenase/alcohol dehydrogenase
LKTRAAVLYELNKPLVVEDIDVTPVGHGQVLVRVAYSGVCRSQLNEVKGNRGEDPFLPHTLGHEGSGIVEEIGHGVTKVKPGDHVVISWIAGNGLDVPIHNYYKKGDQVINSGAVSTFNEYAVVSENRLIPIISGMPMDIAALMGCCVPTGFGTVLNTPVARAGGSIAVFGVGSVGLCSVIAASSFGHFSKIIAVDVQKHKLDLATSLGATHVIDASCQDPVRRILEITKGLGVYCCVEASGVKEVIESAFRATYAKGLLVVAGNVISGELVKIDPFDLIKGKRIMGTWGGETNQDIDIPKYINLYLSGKLPLERLITHRYRLEEINDAFEALESGLAIKSLIEMERNET